MKSSEASVQPFFLLHYFFRNSYFKEDLIGFSFQGIKIVSMERLLMELDFISSLVVSTNA